eukprot:16435515-Heterocapsa_arctica.AAC.1
MRPLTLPDKLIRIISAVTLIVLSNGLKKHLCSDQAMLGKGNEALAHYSIMQHFLDEGVVLDGPESDVKNSPHCPAKCSSVQRDKESRIA